jgi:hypothetical protein
MAEKSTMGKSQQEFLSVGRGYLKSHGHLMTNSVDGKGTLRIPFHKVLGQCICSASFFHCSLYFPLRESGAGKTFRHREDGLALGKVFFKNQTL